MIHILYYYFTLILYFKSGSKSCEDSSHIMSNEKKKGQIGRVFKTLLRFGWSGIFFYDFRGSCSGGRLGGLQRPFLHVNTHFQSFYNNNHNEYSTTNYYVLIPIIYADDGQIFYRQRKSLSREQESSTESVLIENVMQFIWLMQVKSKHRCPAIDLCYFFNSQSHFTINTDRK